MTLTRRSAPTIGALFDQYWSLIQSKVAEATARGYGTAWRLRVGPSFAAMPITSLTTLEVEVAFASWSGAYSTRRDALSLLSHVCKVAMKGGLIASNPCSGVDLRRVQAPDPTARSLTVEEVRLALAALPADGPYRRFVLALLYTGCRLGEVAGMRVSDVDLESRTIRVERTASPGMHGELRVGPTKGRRIRTVPLAEPFVEVVLEAMEGKGSHDLLFPGPRGGHINSQNLSRALNWRTQRSLVKTFAPDEAPLRWHDFRHTAAVMFVKAGVSMPDVQAVLGHSSLQVTQRYADTRKDAARRAGEALSGYYSRFGLSTSEGVKRAKRASDLDF